MPRNEYWLDWISKHAIGLFVFTLGLWLITWAGLHIYDSIAYHRLPGCTVDQIEYGNQAAYGSDSYRTTSFDSTDDMLFIQMTKQ